MSDKKPSYEEEEYKLTEKLVELGSNKAKTKLAHYKLLGHGCETDADEAVVLLTERVKDDDSEAMWLLGLCYEFGMGTEQDLDEADSLYDLSYDDPVGRFITDNLDSELGSGVVTAAVYSL